MIVMIFMVLLLYVAGNGYLFWELWRTASGMPVWGKVVMTILFWTVAASLLAAIALLESSIPEWLLGVMFRTGAVWIVFLLYTVLLLVVMDVVKIFVRIPGNTLWYAVTVTCCLLAYGYVNYKNPKVEHMDICVKKELAGEGVRMAVVSDLHLGYGTGVSALRDYVELINSQKPDVILITGDLIDNSIRPLLIDPFDEVLGELKAPMGIYMIPGNHEYSAGIQASEDFLKSTPICLLRDSVVTLPCGVQIVGRDDRNNPHRKSLEELISATDENLPTVVLDHQPYGVAQADSLMADVLLCGHTHHGQVWPMNMVTDRIYEQSHGYRHWNHSHVWVSSGLSLWGPPFRIGTDSDMAVIDLHGCRWR